MPNILSVSGGGVMPGPNIQTGVNGNGQGSPIGAQQGVGQQIPIGPNGAAAQNGIPGEGQLQGQQVDFESNFAAFVERMSNSSELTDQVVELLFKDGPAIQQSGDAELVQLMDRLMDTITMDEPEQLLNYMQSQNTEQAKFSGELFDGLRNILSENISDVFKDTITQFIKTYNNYASGEHYLDQMKTIAQDVRNMMGKSYQSDFDQLLEKMDWNAQNGDTKANAQLINQQLIPFMAKYVSRTHDYGSVRTASVLFSLYAVKYEGGDKEQLSALFNRMQSNGDFKMLFESDPEKALKNALANVNEQRTDGQNFSELFSQIVQKGAEGKAGSESMQQYYNVLNSMLANESVYLPVLHMLMPFRYQNKEVMSEMWVDPDAEKDKARKSMAGVGKQIKMFLKFNIQDLGNFEMITMMRDKKVDISLFVPESLEEKPERIGGAIQEILKQNDLGLAGLTVAPKTRDISLNEVFPDIQEKARGINVAV